MTPSLDRRGLARQALGKSIQVRLEAGFDLDEPIDIYALCDRLRVPYRFVPISMEGMYRRTPAPYIILSALRPLARRVFNCGHELGHHVFGHGSTVDALLEEYERRGGASGSRTPRARWAPKDPNEFLVDAFAGFLLLPALGVRQAYATRGTRPEGATPEQHFAVACAFGVGYGTLINHLAYGLQQLPSRLAEPLLAVPRPKIRRAFVGPIYADAPLVFADEHWQLSTLDAEVGTHLLLPPDAAVAHDRTIAFVADTPHGRLFKAVRPGIVRVVARGGTWTAFVRVARYQYVGLGRYRHFEESAEDEVERAAEAGTEASTAREARGTRQRSAFASLPIGDAYSDSAPGAQTARVAESALRQFDGPRAPLRGSEEAPGSVQDNTSQGVLDD